MARRSAYSAAASSSPAPAPLKEWQRVAAISSASAPTAAEAAVVPDYDRFHDILSDAPWGFLASLVAAETSGRGKRERERNKKKKNGSVENGSYSVITKRHLRTNLAMEIDDNNVDYGDGDDEPEPLPFPLGPAPFVRRFNPNNNSAATNRRERIFVRRGRQQQQQQKEFYCFESQLPSALDENRRRSSYEPVRDQAYAELVLRLCPAFFLSLYRYVEKRCCGAKAKGNIGGTEEEEEEADLLNNEENRRSAPPLRLNTTTCLHGPCLVVDPYRASKSGIRLVVADETAGGGNGGGVAATTAATILCYGGVRLCSLELLCGLVQSYRSGRYRTLTLSELLCWDGASLQCRSSASGLVCLRHVCFENRAASSTRPACPGFVFEYFSKSHTSIDDNDRYDDDGNGTTNSSSQIIPMRYCAHDPPCLRIGERAPWEDLDESSSSKSSSLAAAAVQANIPIPSSAAAPPHFRRTTGKESDDRFAARDNLRTASADAASSTRCCSLKYSYSSSTNGVDAGGGGGGTAAAVVGGRAMLSTSSRLSLTTSRGNDVFPNFLICCNRTDTRTKQKSRHHVLYEENRFKEFSIRDHIIADSPSTGVVGENHKGSPRSKPQKNEKKTRRRKLPRGSGTLRGGRRPIPRDHCFGSSRNYRSPRASFLPDTDDGSEVFPPPREESYRDQQHGQQYPTAATLAACANWSVSTAARSRPKDFAYNLKQRTVPLLQCESIAAPVAQRIDVAAASAAASRDIHVPPLCRDQSSTERATVGPYAFRDIVVTVFDDEDEFAPAGPLEAAEARSPARGCGSGGEVPPPRARDLWRSSAFRVVPDGPAAAMPSTTEIHPISPGSSVGVGHVRTMVGNNSSNSLRYLYDDRRSATW